MFICFFMVWSALSISPFSEKPYNTQFKLSNLVGNVLYTLLHHLTGEIPELLNLGTLQTLNARGEVHYHVSIDNRH